MTLNNLRLNLSLIGVFYLFLLPPAATTPLPTTAAWWLKFWPHNYELAYKHANGLGNFVE
jgi:hypothetical protein